MDEGILPHEIKTPIFIAMIILLIPPIFLLFTNQIGLFTVGALFIYMFYFSSSNKKAKKKSENELLKIDNSWFISKYNLTKEIP